MNRGFTLMELLMVLLIITIIAGLSMAALAGATEAAREARTQSMIRKLDSLVMEKWESYQARAVPIKIPPRIGPPDSSGQPTPTTTGISAKIRLYALRDLMRMEFPDRVTDVQDPPALIYQSPDYPSVTIRLSYAPSSKALYMRRASQNAGASWATTWTQQHQGAKCLYLIVSTLRDGDREALDFFSEEEIGDSDGDGMREFLDGWKRPIEFIRWPMGYTKENGALTLQTSAFTTTRGTGSADYRRVCEFPDPFDFLTVDPRWFGFVSDPILPACFGLTPLIFSAGRDKEYDIATILTNSDGTPVHVSALTPPNDPYFTPTVSGQLPLGTPGDINANGTEEWGDNITNHLPVTP